MPPHISHRWMVIATVYTTVMHICLTVESLHTADKIVSLPLQPHVSFQQYSGYITLDEKQKRSLFYYFVEAESGAALKPLVLWLNGGPGCSSVGAGAFVEHGPFRVRGETLVKNEYSWNKVANMLYLESPAGVGFSYSANKSFYNYVNDEMTARDNFIFLQRWFVQFPEYNNRPLFIAGESYAGHYVPQLAQLIVKSKVKFNLKGIAIGNPLLELDTDSDSRSLYFWSHGLISDSTFSLLNSVCNISQITRSSLKGTLSGPCLSVATQAGTELSNSIDPYDVIADICLSGGQSSKLDIFHEQLRSKFQLSSSRLSQPDGVVDEKDSDVCAQEDTQKYLNRKDVQKALHARLIGASKWELCSGSLNYDQTNKLIPTTDVVGSLVKSGIPAMVYSGDQDSVVPFIGTRSLVDALAKQLKLKTTVSYRTWFEGKQVGGWTQIYGNKLSFATIRGAAHTAPSNEPARSLVLFKSFLTGKPLPES